MEKVTFLQNINNEQGIPWSSNLKLSLVASVMEWFPEWQVILLPSRKSLVWWLFILNPPKGPLPVNLDWRFRISISFILNFVEVLLVARDCIKIAMWSKSWSRWKHLIKHMGSEPMCERFRDVWDPKQPLAMQKICNEGTVLVKQYTVFFFIFFLCNKQKFMFRNSARYVEFGPFNSTNWWVHLNQLNYHTCQVTLIYGGTIDLAGGPCRSLIKLFGLHVLDLCTTSHLYSLYFFFL